MKIKTHRFLAGFLAMVMLVGLLPVKTSAGEADRTITTLGELQQWAAEVNAGNSYEGKTVFLAADIALGGESDPWTPIGNANNAFKGIFDGGYHVISGLSISDSKGKNVGFFGSVEGGTVENLTVKGSVSGQSNVAGLVGSLKNGTVTNCANNADVAGVSAVGGVVGYVGGASVIRQCYNSGTVSGTQGYIGGVTGQHWQAGEVQDCYNAGTVKGPATVGGISGGHKASSPVLANCYNAGEIIDSTGNSNNIGAVIGASKGSNTNCYYIKGKGTDSKSGITEVDALTAAMLSDAFKEDEDGLNGGYPVLTWQKRVPDVIICSYEEFKSLADKVNNGESYEGQLIRLDVNLYLGGEKNPWTPIGSSANVSFKGIFDGNYHVISGLYIETTSQNAGLFGVVQGGTVKNLVVQGQVKGTSYVGGVVGSLKGGSLVNCGNQADVSGGSYVGGVVGYGEGTAVVEGCYNQGHITGTTGYIGGVIGTLWGSQTAKNCYNGGTVTGPATVGGVLGGHRARSPILENCYNAGTVENSGSRVNNHGSVIGAQGTAVNCYDLSGSSFAGVGSTGAEVNKVSSLAASQLSSAFVDGTEAPLLSWESRISTEAPVRPAFVESTELSARLAEYIKAAVKSTKTQAGIGGTLLGDEGYMAGASSTATDWMALAMGRFGYFDGSEYYYQIDDGTGYADYLAAMKAYIEKTYAENNGILHSAKATEWHRAVVAIAALRGNPSCFGTYNGASIDLIADGSYNNSLKAGPGTQGINGWIWGLIAMDTGMYEVPANAKYTREDFITEILKMQLTDGVNGNEYGGWVLGGYGSSSDVDITAMAIQALAPYYNEDTAYTYTNENSKAEVTKTVRQCVDEALDRLGAMMNKNGGFTSWNTNNVESISQVVVALCSLGIRPSEDERFITADGKTLLDGMLQFRLSNGGFRHTLDSGWNSMANDQATYALVSYWRLENNMRALYDMRDNWTAEETEALKAAVAAIQALPQPSAADYKKQLKTALAAFRAVPEDERRYVNNYAQLAMALELVGGEDALDNGDPYIVSIEVTQNPEKVKYFEGDRFDPAGMKVEALYSDGRREEINGYKLSVTGELALTVDTVYITYGILKTSISIEVREKMPWEGEGTEENPYQIKNADDLVDLRNYVDVKRIKTEGVYFKITQDINMKNIDDWRGIADTRTGGFQGHLDGDGHAIWNLNASTYNACGLFGRLGNGAVIENLTIASGNLGGNYIFSIGAIAGEVVSGATATIRNCHNYADLNGTWGIGGILGQVEDKATAIIEGCSNHGTITASYTGGGIIGQVGPNRWKANGARADISDCYNTGEIKGDGNWGIGGIVGSYRLGGSEIVSSITNCYNAGTVKDSTAAGAILGSIAETKVKLENVYYREGSHSKMNGSFTDGGRDTAGTIEGQAATRTESAMKEAAFVLELGTAFAEDGEGINNGYPVLKLQKALGSEAPVRAGLEIGTAEELLAFAQRVKAGESFTNKTVILTANIDLSNITDWEPIGSRTNQFDGIFDGRYYVIDNLYSTSGGLFGYVNKNAVIKNVGLASGEVGSRNSSFIGGIARYSNGADFINCWNGADIYCRGYGGGVVGTVRDGGDSKIEGCYNIGSVYALEGDVGGIVGHLGTTGQEGVVNVSISGCYNAGRIQASDGAAGIVGRVQDGHTIKNCYNVGEILVTGNNILSGAGAIASLVTSQNTITNCYYNSDIFSCGVSNGKDTTTGKTTEEMKAEEFTVLLGEEFKQDPYALVNGGYPLVYWQKTEEADDVKTVIEKIDAIGTVTLEKENIIKEARMAYDELSDEAKAFVDNYDVLVKAEKELAELKNNASGGEESGGSSGDEHPETPSTGDNSNVLFYIVLMMASLGAALIAMKSRKRA